MNLKNLLKLFADKNCSNIYVKELQKNNNSKQQIYLATGDTQVLNLLPVTDFKASDDGKQKTVSFHASSTFYWLDDTGAFFRAPHAKFILYPDYPEVRFSGFIRGCEKAPSEILNNAVAGRLLFLGICENDEIFGYAAEADSVIAKEFSREKNSLNKIGILYSIDITSSGQLTNSRNELLRRLKEINGKNWIASKQLKPGNTIEDCLGTRCGGYTIEAELSIIQNGKSEPDFMGWEIKQFSVKKPHLLRSSTITLITTEPDGGYYSTHGVLAFLKKYGYDSKKTIDRLDFTGSHYINSICEKSNLKMTLIGFDEQKNQIVNAEGGLFLIDKKENIAASWSFSKILKKWNEKHAKACYIPSMMQKEPQKYKYLNKIFLGVGTDFSYLLKNLYDSKIYYDPAIRVKNVSSKPDEKRRSQFRMKSRTIYDLYQTVELIDLDEL
jgi:hypothetical protein